MFFYRTKYSEIFEIGYESIKIIYCRMTREPYMPKFPLLLTELKEGILFSTSKTVYAFMYS